MARQKKPYMVFETSEEFEKEFKQIFESGRQRGYTEGISQALSYVYELTHEPPFDDYDIQMNAQYILADRRKGKFEYRRKVIESAKRDAVQEYIAEQCKKVEEQNV